MKTLIAITIIGAVVSAFNLRAENTPSASTPYDPAPEHLWNRLNETLFIRTGFEGKQFGFDEPDILYWVGTKHLLDQPSHQQALAILDEFINSHAEKLIQDPLKRVLLQHDLWELFDWAAMPGRISYRQERNELESRLAIVIRRLALTTNEIASLPDNYAESVQNDLPDLPQGLFQTDGDWVNLSPGYDREIAPAHDHYFGACSPFLVMMHTPGGRQEATNYLNQLDSADRVLVYRNNQFSSEEFLTLRDDLPQFPAKTEFVLVRRMCVIDTDGDIVSTPITQSIQMRRYLAISEPERLVISNRLIIKPPQQFFEFRMTRGLNASLRMVGTNETDFLFFMTKGFDSFDGVSEEQARQQNASMHFLPVLHDCTTCHTAAGIYSVNSYTRFFGPRYLETPKLYSSDPDGVIKAAIAWKKDQYSWGVLQGLWNQAN
jgi:hypothetical protein